MVGGADGAVESTVKAPQCSGYKCPNPNSDSQRTNATVEGNVDVVANTSTVTSAVEHAGESVSGDSPVGEQDQGRLQDHATVDRAGSVAVAEVWVPGLGLGLRLGMWLGLCWDLDQLQPQSERPVPL